MENIEKILKANGYVPSKCYGYHRVIDFKNEGTKGLIEVNTCKRFRMAIKRDNHKDHCEDNDNFLFEQVSKFNTLDDINTTIKYVNSYFGLNIKEIKFDNENTR